MRLGECPGSAKGPVNQGCRIDMTKWPVTRHTGKSRYPESFGFADCPLEGLWVSAFSGRTSEVETGGKDGWLVSSRCYRSNL